MPAFVIGNVAVDETISVSAMPEPGASIHGVQQTRELGGKGANQAIVMGRSGLAVTLVTAVGRDFRAETIRSQLTEEPIDVRLIVLADVSSDLSIVLTTPDGENANITTTESAGSLSLDAALAPLQQAIPGDLVVLQGNLADEVTRGILAAAKSRGLTTAFNPSPLRPCFSELWPLVDIAFLNEVEARSLTGASGEGAVLALRSASVGHVVLTLGAAGALLADAGGIVSVPAAAAKAVDTTGAGDSFMAAALASASLRRAPLDARAIGHAAAVAALTVSRRGTRSAFPTRQELAAILHA
jgi:ribokinase